MKRVFFGLSRVGLFHAVALAVLGCHTASTPQSPIQSPSPIQSSQRLVWSSSCGLLPFNETPHPFIPRVLVHQPEQYSQFQAQYLRDPEEALKQWLLSTSTFAHLRGSPTELRVRRLNTQFAWANFGVYQVFAPSHAASDEESEFILKVGAHENEIFNLWKIENSLIGHPECFLTASSSSILGARPQGVGSASGFPKLYEYAQFETSSSERNPTGNLFVFLMSRARGVVLSDINELSDDTLRAYRWVGKSLGTLHYFHAVDSSLPFEQWVTVSHGDAHWGNIFVDLAQEKVTLIDLDRIAVGNHFKFDLFMAGFPQMRAVLLGRFNEMIRRLEINRRGSELVGDFSFGMDEALRVHAHLIQLLRDGSFIAEVQVSRDHQILSHFAERILAMRDGYLELIPTQHHSEVKGYFSSLCRETTEDLMRNFSFFVNVFRQQNAILEELRDGFRNVFPEALNRCIDGV